MARPIDMERLRSEYLAGKSAAQIAAELGVVPQTIHNRLRILGITRRRSSCFTYHCKTEGCDRPHHAYGYCSGCFGGVRYRENKEAIEARRKRAGYENEKRYEKTLKGHLVRTYRNMKSRVLGIQKRKAHLYVGMALLPKEDFYAWSEANPQYLALYAAWTTSGFDRRLTPSIDRIDSERGYTIDNMRWLTHGENSAIGGASKRLARKPIQG